MAEKIKLRNIRELRNLPISEMTDEEIVKATYDRLNAKCVVLAYDFGEGYMFLGRHKNGHKTLIDNLYKPWVERYGEFKSIDEEV